MATLVFDIETVGEDWDAMDATTQSVLTRWIDKTARTEEERIAQIDDLKEGLGFSPLTGEIVAIGVGDYELDKGVVYYQNGGAEEEETTVENYTLKPRTEKQMLEDFWEGAKKYGTFVTFNGRGFDVPFILMRSIVHGVKPTCDLMSGRYLYQQRGVKHIDLQDQLSFYGSVRRMQALHLYCRAFGIESPKAEGVSGDDVAALFTAGEYRTIAEYNIRDVVATAELYTKWREYLTGN